MLIQILATAVQEVYKVHKDLILLYLSMRFIDLLIGEGMGGRGNLTDRIVNPLLNKRDWYNYLSQMLTTYCKR